MDRPIRVIYQRGITNKQVLYAMDGIREVLDLMNVTDQTLITIGTTVIETGKTLDEYIADVQGDSLPAGPIDFSRLFGSIFSDLNRSQCKILPYYVLIIDRGLRFNQMVAYGVGSHDYCAVISVYDIKTGNLDMDEECLKTIVMHEIGHMFGLIPKDRKINYMIDCSGKHCLNRCVMRSPAILSNGMVGLTLDRMNDPGFCPQCLDYLRRCYKSPAADDEHQAK